MPNTDCSPRTVKQIDRTPSASIVSFCRCGCWKRWKRWRTEVGSRNSDCFLKKVSFGRLFAAFLLTYFQFVAISPLSAQRAVKNEVKRPFKENVTLPIDSNLEKRFGTLQDLLGDQRWDEAFSLVQEIVQTDGKSLVAMIQPVKVGGNKTYVNAATRCNLLIAKVSADGRNAYRRKVDPQARRWYDNWLRSRDESELVRIVRQAYLSSFGDDALWALGEAAWDRGDFSAAGLWWEQLIPLPDDADPGEYPTVLRYPDTDLDRPAILARVVLCSAMEGWSDRAADQLRQFAEQFPHAEGWICGQRGRFVDLLRTSIADAGRSKRISATAAVATFGLSPERYQQIPESVDVGALRWVRPLPPNLLPHHAERLPFLNEPLSYHPVVHDNIVIVNDADTIRAWNILTGEPAWPSDRRDPTVIYPSVPDEPTLPPDKNCVGVPHYTMTISDGRLYARMGSPVTCSSTAELRRDFASDLVCLDLTHEGKLVWKIAAHELFSDDPPWRYEGSPVIVNGHAYVAVCRRHPQLELMVACLNASDGRLIWQRPVGAFRASVDDTNNRVSHLLLTAGGGRVYLSTDVGAIYALDAVDGRLEWAISYETRSDEPIAVLSDPGRKGLMPPMFHAGLLFVAPNDSSSAYCLEADSGRIRWRYSYLRNVPQDFPDPLRREQEGNRLRNKQWRNLLGVVPGGRSGRLIVSGQTLIAIDIDSGNVVWERGDNSSNRGNHGAFGRGLIADSQVLFPTRETIEIYNSETGEHLRSVPLKTTDATELGGNLTLAGGMLLIAEPNRLAAYCEFSRLKERIERELTERTDDVPLRIQLADLEMAEGHLDAATAGFQRILEKIDRDEPLYLTTRRKLAKLFQDTGNAEFSRQNPAAARDHWLKALSFFDDVTKRVDLLFDLAKVDEALNHPNAALVRLQEILSDDRLASVNRDSQTAGTVATEQMRKLITHFGRDSYHPIESAARTELESLVKTTDRQKLQQWIVKYPHSQERASAETRLADLYLKSGEFSEAYAVIGDHGLQAADDQSFVRTMLARIKLLQGAGYTNSANRLWSVLGSRKDSMRIEVDGSEVDLKELAITQLRKTESKTVARPSILERTWSCPLPSDNRVIVPDGISPAAEFGAVLVCSKQLQPAKTWLWQCLDWHTGQVRWEETASEPILLAGWTPVHLLVATPNGWQARSVENGRRIWQQISLSEGTPHLVPQSSDFDNEARWPAMFDLDHGLQLYDPNDGHVAANLKPPGRLHSIVGFAVGQRTPTNDAAAKRSSEVTQGPAITVLMQTVKPTRTWRASASSPRMPWKIDEISDGGEPWQSAPLSFGSRIVGLTTDHHLLGLGLDQPASQITRVGESNEEVADSSRTDRWVHDNFAIGQAPPTAFARQQKLFVLVDGSQFASFDVSTGRRNWTTGLADFPLKSPCCQVCTDDECVFAASQGILRAVSFKDGSVCLEKYLGDTAPQWQTRLAWIAEQGQSRVQSAGDLISPGRRKAVVACWPLTTSQDKVYQIRLCDAETGAIRQQLQVESAPQELLINADGYGLLWLSDRLFGLRFASTNSIVEARRKPVEH